MDTFYKAEYVDANGKISVNETFVDDAGVDPAIYVKVLAVLLIRAGLFISEVLSIPSGNTQALVLHNIVDLAVVSIGYGLVGFIFAFGEDYMSFIGIRGFISEISNHNDFILGWSILIVVSGLLTASIGDRISFFAGLVLNFLIGCVAFPFPLHWILNPKGWMKSMHFAGVMVSYKDYSHSCLIHMAGGYVCFLGMFVLDKRMLRFKDLDSSSIPEIGPNIALFGYFLTLTGFFCLSMPTQNYFKTHLVYNFYGIILINMIFSVFGTVLTTLLLTFSCPCRDRNSKWANLRFAQGAVAGVAVIAGGLDVYYPITSLGAGLVNGLVFFVESQIMNKSNLEDFCNISAVHFFSGFLGTLLPPLLGVREGFKMSTYTDFIHFSWQLIGDAAILAYLSVIFIPVLLMFDRCGVLRTWEEEMNHRRAISTMEMSPKVKLLKRLFDWGEGDWNPNSLKDRVGGMEIGEKKSDKVNILYQKKITEGYSLHSKRPHSGIGDESSRELQPALQKSVTYPPEGKKVMHFFEEVENRSAKTHTPTSKELSSGKSFDSKVMKGLRNISDSKLLNRIRNSVTGSSKKKIPKSSESRSGFSSISNTWVQSSSHLNYGLETQM